MVLSTFIAVAIAWSGPGMRAPVSRVAGAQMVAADIAVGVKRNPNMAKLQAGCALAISDARATR